MIKLSEIWIYPVKSLGGIRLKTAQVEGRGLQYDRRWLIVDEVGQFVTQRALPKMALIDVALDADALILTSRTDQEQIRIPFRPVTAHEMTVKIWADETSALTVSDEADRWLSQKLDKNVRLVTMPDTVERKVDPCYAKNNENVSFADGYPFLIISQTALDNLNEKLEVPITMKRFRPNFVITGTLPHAEDDWTAFQVGNIGFEIVKPCSRCVLTTIDPETADKGSEPLKTLAGYRRFNNKILFGQNVVTQQTGIINQNDEVIILAAK